MRGRKTGGRQRGQPNKVTAAVRQAATEIVRDTGYRAALRRRLIRGDLPPQVEVLLWHYAYGRPTQTARAETDHPDVGRLSDEELHDRLLAAWATLNRVTSDHAPR
jgi:hypothetical protein